MAVQGHAVNQAAVNSGYNIVIFGAAALAAASTVSADITYVHHTSSASSSTAVLESYVWQFHNTPFSANAKATILAPSKVQKWETANFSADAELTSYILAIGANGIFNCSATIQEDISYVWRVGSSGSAVATAVVDQTQSNRATAFPTADATLYADGMLKLSGQSVYTHDGSAKPTILGQATFANIQAILKPDGWYAPAYATISAPARFKRFIKAKPTGKATFIGFVKTNFFDTVNLSATAQFVPTEEKTAYAGSTMAVNAVITGAYGRNKQLIKSTMSAPAATTATATADRFGTYPVFDGTATVEADTIMTLAGVTDMLPSATIVEGSYQWHFHDDGAATASTLSTISADAAILKGSDAVTFVRPPDLKEFERPQETKDFVRVAT